MSRLLTKTIFIIIALTATLSGDFSAANSPATFQEIGVKSFKILENDLDARVHYPKRDQNNEVCAIIKVVTPMTGFSFDVGSLGVVATEQRIGEIWVYVPRGVQRMTISHQQLGFLRNYPFPEAIKSATVYEMTLVTAELIVTVREKEILTQWLAINTTPEGANIFVNEKPVGTTPYTGQFSEGEYSYRIELPKYHTEAGKVTLKGKRETLLFTMRPKFGNISVTSVPESGMLIYLNDENTEKSTPATLSGVTSGAHSIKLIDKWYQIQSKNITVTDNQTTTVSFTMEPAFANITVSSSPSADIFIDNIKKGTGEYKSRMLTGIYTLKAELEKHHPQQRQLVVETGKDQNIQFALKPIIGRLDITSTPFDAKIKLNGKDYGTTPTTINNLLIGTYNLTLEKEGYKQITQIVKIEENSTSTINLKLEDNKRTTDNVYTLAGTVTDIDGNVYHTVTIGKQVWMVENLKTTRYRNGDIIGTTSPARLDISNSRTYPTPKYQWAYAGNESNVASYGRLYTWYAATDSRGLCPTGWHLPSNAEWTTLTTFLGGESVAGGKLKEAGKSHWSVPNKGATNSSGFTALPGGYRHYNATFNNIGANGYWWSSTENYESNAGTRNMHYNYSNVNRNNYPKTNGFSVRCLRDN